jgi:hypothetical protein
VIDETDGEEHSEGDESKMKRRRMIFDPKGEKEIDLFIHVSRPNEVTNLRRWDSRIVDHIGKPVSCRVWIVPVGC